MDGERQYQPPEQGYEFPENPTSDPDVDDDESIEQPLGGRNPPSDQTH